MAVIGGGNVSMDAVRTAVRLGARKVSIVYRRRAADMTALEEEIQGAVAEGVEVKTLMAPSKIEVSEDGYVKGIWVTPQMISRIQNGRASVRPTGEEDIFIPCETLVVAIGQDILYEHFEENGVPVQRGKIKTEKYGGFDDIPGVFAGETVQRDRPRLFLPSLQEKSLLQILMNILVFIMKSPVMWKFRSHVLTTVLRAAGSI